MVVVIAHAPGAVAAGTNIDIPDWAPKIRELVAAIKVTLSDATVAGSIANLTVVSETPASGQIQLVDENTYKLGDDTTARDLIILVYVAKGEYSGA